MAPPASAASTGRPTINYGILADSLSSMDPIQTFGKPAHELAFLMYSALVRYAPGNASAPIQPDLTTKVPTSQMVNGKQVWTADLRQGVMCPKGVKTPAYELTSSDVVFSLQRAADPKQSLWAGQYVDYDSVKAQGKFKVAITLKEPESSAVFLPTIANYLGGFIVCQKAVQAEGDTMFGQDPVGTGPFMFKSLNPGQSATLVANDSYFRGKPTAAGWNIRFFSSATAEQAALLSGEIDAVDSPPVATDAWDKVISSHTGFKVVKSPIFGETYLFFDTQNQYLSNVKVRQAIAYAANRNDYVATVGSAAQPAFSAWSNAFRYGIPNSHTQKAGLAYNFNLAKAKALMKAAGYPNGFSLTVDSTSGTNIMDILQAQLQKIGIKLNLKVVDPTTYEKDISTKNQAIFTNALGFFGSPQELYSNYFLGDGALNWTHYSGADNLIAQAGKQTNLAAQQKLWTEINDKILSDMAALPLYTSDNVYAGVCGFTWGGANPPIKIPSSWDGTYKATVNSSDKSC